MPMDKIESVPLEIPDHFCHSEIYASRNAKALYKKCTEIIAESFNGVDLREMGEASEQVR